MYENQETCCGKLAHVMHWMVAPLATSLIIVLLVCTGGCQRGNKQTFDSQNAALEELLQKKVGEAKPPYNVWFMLQTVDKEASQIKNETGAVKAVRAVYKVILPRISLLPASEESVELNHALARFDSTERAIASLQRAARERGLKLESKTKNGIEIGKMFRDHEGSYVAWTNGSLLSLVATRNSTLATEFEDGCPY